MMTTDTRPTPRIWEPPGPGTWELVADHYPRPVTAAMLPFLDVWSEVSTAWMVEVGLPIKGARMCAVHGLPYISIDTGDGGRKPPPAWVMRMMIRLVPSMRRAERTLQAVLEARPWVEAVARWYDHDRNAAVERMLVLGRVEVGSLDDAALADHLEACRAELMASAAQHLRMHAHDTFPPGLFVVRAMDLGFERDEALALLRGASPASTGTSDELAALRAAVAGRHAADLDELRALDPDVAAALDRYLEIHGARLVDGYDLDACTIGEQPGLVVALATAPPPVDDVAEQEQRLSEARARVPADARADFDRLLEDGRVTYGVRDDNSGILVCWPSGLLRLAMLEAGRRLGIGDLAIEASVEELRAGLVGGTVDAATLADRAAQRRSLTAADAPKVLGPPSPPAPEGIPGALGEVFRIFALFEEPATDPDAAVLCGMGLGTEPYTGRARLVPGGNVGLADFEPGDVLVAPMTSPSYNVLLSLAGALVTDAGGALSHAAIMARELDLPAVIGAAGATARIADGDTVTVDPVAGTVVIG